jgi:hypothetical protein
MIKKSLKFMAQSVAIDDSTDVKAFADFSVCTCIRGVIEDLQLLQGVLGVVHVKEKSVLVMFILNL